MQNHKNWLHRHFFPFILVSFLLLLNAAATAYSQSSGFTFQGHLTDMGNPANGSYQMEFKMFDALTDGNQIGATISDVAVTVAQGVFTTRLDFGANAFAGADRFLEIGVRRNSNEAYTTLSPRQHIASSPYTIKALYATQANVALDATKLGGIDASEYVTTSSVGSSFIRNATTLQTANFNISGDGFLGGNLGIGTASPLAKLHLLGDNFRFQTAGGKILDFTSGSVLDMKARNTSLAISSEGANGDNNLYLNPNASNGNVTVGTFAPLSKLTIGTSLASYGLTHTNGSVIVGTYVDSLGGWFGTKTNHSLHFFTNDSLPRATLTSTGFGIGTTNPLGPLHLRSPGTATPIYLSTGSGSEGAATFRLQTDSGLTGQGKSFVIYSDDAAQYRFIINGIGNIGIGTITPTQKLEVVGTTKTNILQITGGSDLAEHFEMADEEIKPGMVVAIDPQNAGKLILARGAYNRRVAGIISGANHLSAGMLLPDLKEAKNSQPVALSGRVWVYADATKNPIQPGDLLTTSATAGYAMKVTNHKRAPGAIIGKAMTKLKSGTGLVLVLVSLQ